MSQWTRTGQDAGNIVPIWSRQLLDQHWPCFDHTLPLHWSASPLSVSVLSNAHWRDPDLWPHLTHINIPSSHLMLYEVASMPDVEHINSLNPSYPKYDSNSNAEHYPVAMSYPTAHRKSMTQWKNVMSPVSTVLHKANDVIAVNMATNDKSMGSTKEM